MRAKPPTSFTFRAHGQFTTRVDGRLIISDVTGPWNKELVEQWAAASHPLAQALGPHVGIAVVRESMLCTPDALLVLRRAAQYAATSLACMAHVLVADKSVDGRDLIDASFIRAYDGALRFAIFYSLEEAQAWALALLAEQGL
jgi:hypothetical protein